MTFRNTGERVKIFIGTEPKTEIARKVLQCSITRHTDMQVDFIPMIGKEWEYNHENIPVGTGFSLRRWMIPAFCNWEGRAIYMDADQLVFGDVWDLWTKPEQMPDKKCSAWMTYQVDKFCNKPWPQSSVMVIDCAKAKSQWGWYIREILDHLRKFSTKRDYADFMHCAWMAPAPHRIEDGWNNLNIYVKDKTKLLHYTKEPEQPMYKPDHPLADFWQKELIIALGNKLVSELEIREAIAKWKVIEDWRNQNGLHPDYARFLSNPNRVGTKKRDLINGTGTL